MSLYLPKLYLSILYIVSCLPLRINFILAFKFYTKNWYMQSSNRKQYQHLRNGHAIYSYHLLLFYKKLIYLLFFVLLSDMWYFILCRSELEFSYQLFTCGFYLSHAYRYSLITCKRL